MMYNGMSVSRALFIRLAYRTWYNVSVCLMFKVSEPQSRSVVPCRWRRNNVECRAFSNYSLSYNTVVDFLLIQFSNVIFVISLGNVIFIFVISVGNVIFIFFLQFGDIVFRYLFALTTIAWTMYIPRISRNTHDPRQGTAVGPRTQFGFKASI